MGNDGQIFEASMHIIVGYFVRFRLVFCLYALYGCINGPLNIIGWLVDIFEIIICTM